MKIEYVRNMQLGYMRMIVQAPLKEVEEKMLRNNKIEGILPVQCQRENENYVLRYDITGKQALDEVLLNTAAEEWLFKSLLAGIGAAIKQMEKYLLLQDGLLLLPETIFWDYKTETMYFCYCPEVTHGLREQFVSLLEYLLAKTNHKNVMAVQLIYGVYEEAIKPTFYMKELEKYLEAYMTKPKEVCEETYEVEEEEVSEKNTDITAERNMHKIKGIKNIMARIRDEIKKKTKQEQKEQVILYKEPEVKLQDAVTTILGRDEDVARGYLKYEGLNSLPDIPVIKTPFVIGTAESCDGILKHPNISHYHAKITYQDSTYFIEDLNSTNGTRVNGGLLSYKTRVSLKKNESIYFANEPYRFL